jgi:arsenate reductase
MARPGFFREIAVWLSKREEEWPLISGDRQAALHVLGQWIRTTLESGRRTQLVFICTHNSRRSQLAQILAHSAARLYGVPEIETFSGGTEVTAFSPRAVAALRRAGFTIEVTPAGKNPRYAVSFGPVAEATVCFSKTYDQPPNPSSGFCAVMTCSAADSACPIVLGASERINIRYDDPKAFDDTDQETTMYDERCRQIAREMLYLFSLVTAG